MLSWLTLLQTLKVSVFLLLFFAPVGQINSAADESRRDPLHRAVGAQSDPATDNDHTPEISEEELQAQRTAERFLSVLLRQPKTGAAFERVYTFHLDHESLDELLASLRQDAEQESLEVIRRSHAWLVLGLLEEKRGRHADAANCFLTAAELSPESPLPAWHLGRSLLVTGQASAAAQALERAMECAPANDDQLAILKDLGRAYQRSGDAEKAAGIWQRMKTLFPSDLRVKEQIATLLNEEGDVESALSIFTELATLHRDPYQASQFAIQAAELKVRLGRGEEALNDLEAQQAKLDPDSWLFREVRRRIQALFLQADDPAGLIAYYESWLKSHPQDLDAMMRLGRLLTTNGRSADAGSLYVQALKLAPSDVRLRQALIESYLREKRYDEAIQQYEELQRLQPGNTDIIVAWGNLCLHRHDLSPDDRKIQATEVWMKLVQDRPNDASTTARLAELMVRILQTEQAVELYRRAIELAPAELQYRESLGEVLHAAGRRAEAVSAWTSIAEGESRNAEHLTQVADLLHRYGYFREAMAAMAEVCHLDPTVSLRLKYVQMLRDAEAMEIRLPEQTGNTSSTELMSEALRQLDLADSIAETVEEHNLIIDERIRCLKVTRNLEQTAADLAASLNQGINATSTRWRLLAVFRDACGQPELAIQGIETAIRLEPDSVASLRVAARLFEGSGRTSEALKITQRLTTLDSRSRIEHLQQQAELQRKLGRKQEALQTAKQLVTTAPGNPAYLQLYTNLCSELGLRDEEINALRRAVGANPSDHIALQSLAKLLAGRNQSAEAIELYWKALQQSADAEGRTNIAVDLAQLHLRTHQFDRLIQKLAHRGDDSVSDRDRAMCLAVAFETAGDVQSAETALESGLFGGSQDAAILKELSRLFEKEGEIEKSVDYQRRLNIIQPAPEGTERLASLLLKLGDTSEAESLWASLIELNPEPGQVLQAINQLIDIDSFEAAREGCQRVLATSPENWEALVRLAVVEWRMGQKQVAMELFARVLAETTPVATPSVVRVSKQTLRQPIDSPEQLEAPVLRRLHHAPVWLRVLGVSAHTSASDRMTPDAKISNRNPQKNSVSAAIEDFGAARGLCLTAQLVHAMDNNLSIVDLKNQAAEFQAGTRTAWDIICTRFIYDACFGHSKSASPELVHLLKQQAMTDDDEAKMVFLSIVSAEATKVFKTLPRPGTTPAMGIYNPSSRPALNPDNAELAMSCLEEVLTKQPGWLTTFDPKSFALWWMNCGSSEQAASQIVRFSTEGNSRHLLNAALQLGNSTNSLFPEQSLELLTRIQQLDRLAGPGFLNSQKQRAEQWDEYVINLRNIAEQSAPSDSDANLQALAWWMQWKNRLDRRSENEFPLTFSAGKLRDSLSELRLAAIRRSDRNSIPEDHSQDAQQTAGNELQQLSVISPLSMTELSFLSAVFREGDGDYFDKIRAWLHKQRESGVTVNRVLLDYTEALYCRSQGQMPDALVHLVRAAAGAPDDVLLRFELATWLEDAGRFQDAITVLEELSGGDPELVRTREVKVLLLAEQLKDAELAQRAAQRLYALESDAETDIFLLRKLRGLGMIELADQVDRRGRKSMPTQIPSTSPAELLELYEKQGNQTAAIQIAQQLIRQSSGGGTPWRNPQRLSPVAVQARAFEVLCRTGELDRMIERQRAQVKQAPHSRVLQTTLVEYLEASGKAEEAAEIQKQIIGDLNGRSSENMLMLVEQLRKANHSVEASETLLNLLEEHPTAFWDKFEKHKNLLDETDRLSDVVDLLLADEHRNASSQLSMDSLRFLIQSLTKHPEPDPRAAQFLQLTLRLHGTESVAILTAVKHDATWNSPPVFAVLMDHFVPKTEAQALRSEQLWFPDDEDFSQDGFDDPTHGVTTAELNIMLLQKALASAPLRQEFRERVQTCQQSFPDWHAGHIMLIVAAVREFTSVPENADTLGTDRDGTAELKRETDALLNMRTRRIPQSLACSLARTMVMPRHDLHPISRALLHRSLEGQSHAEFLGAPAAIELLHLQLQAGEIEAARAFVLQHARGITAQADTVTVADEESVAARFAAATALVRVQLPVEALAMMQPLKPQDEDVLFEKHNALVQRIARPGARRMNLIDELRERALSLLTPNFLTAELRRSREGLSESATALLPRVDLAIRPAVVGSEYRLRSQIVNWRTVNADLDAIRGLNTVVMEAMKIPTTDPSVLILALSLVIRDGNESMWKVLRPRLDEYLSRPVPTRPAGTSDDDFLKMIQPDLALAVISIPVRNDHLWKQSVQKMRGRSCAVARQFDDNRFLAATLLLNSEALKADERFAEAEEALVEMRQVLAAVESESTTPVEILRGSLPSEFSESDVTAELQKTLLIPLVP